MSKYTSSVRISCVGEKKSGSFTVDPRAAELAAGRKKMRLSRRKNRRLAVSRAEKKMRLSHRKNAASRQQERKNAAKCPAMSNKLEITVQSSYNHAVKLRCCIKIGKSQKTILFRTLWAIDVYVELYDVYTKKWCISGLTKTRLNCDAELIMILRN